MVHPAVMAPTTVKLYLAIFRRAFENGLVEIDCGTYNRKRTLKNALYGAIQRASKEPQKYPDAQFLRSATTVRGGYDRGSILRIMRKADAPRSGIAADIKVQLGISDIEMESVVKLGGSNDR